MRKNTADVGAEPTTNQTLPDRDAYSIEEFAERHNLSRSTVYDLLAKGRGPRVIKAGARTLVSREAAARWRKEQEAAYA